jgi:hypothetical protein
MVDSLEVGQKIQAMFSDGAFYPATVVTLSDSKKRAKAPVKVNFTGYASTEDAWLGVDELKFKKAKGKGKGKDKAEPKAKAKAKAKAEPAKKSKDGGSDALAKMKSYKGCVLAEYVWLDAHQTPRSKTMTMTSKPTKPEDLRIWNYDGSSTEQAEGHNSEVLLYPRAIFDDPFRGAPHVLVLAEAINAWDKKPSIGNTRAECAEIMDKYKSLDPWFGIEQEYTLMKPGKIGETPKVPLGFNADGSEPAARGHTTALRASESRSAVRWPTTTTPSASKPVSRSLVRTLRSCPASGSSRSAHAAVSRWVTTWPCPATSCCA